MNDLSEARAWCGANGLGWDESAARQAEALFSALSLTDEQANALVIHHAWRLAWMFNPAAYGWGRRVCLALHFLVGRTPALFRKSEG